jgi:capsule polysaccharide export protein KpsE/RkpR
VLSFIEGSLAEKKRQLDASEERRMVWRSANSTWPQSGDAEMLMRLAELDRDVQIHLATYITLAEQYEIARIESQKDLHTVTVLDHPNLPRTRSHPKRKLIVVVSSVLGLMVGVFAVFVQEAWLNHPEVAGLLRRRVQPEEETPVS